MEPFELAWERQPDDRQWEKPEGDDPRTLYQMLMTSVDRFGDLPCFGYIPAPGVARTHLSYNEFGDLATRCGEATRCCWREGRRPGRHDPQQLG